MQDFIVAGSRVMTTDAVANALFEFALTLAKQNKIAVVQFPAVVEGRLVEAKMMLGRGIHVMTVTVESEIMIDVHGADSAGWEIRQRTAALAGHATQIDWGHR